MGVFEQFPYTNFHNLNLDWIVEKINEFQNAASPEAVANIRADIAALQDQFSQIGAIVNAAVSEYLETQYQIPAATADRIGGVIVGALLSVDASGRVSVNVDALPAASAITRGLMQVGAGLLVEGGAVSVNYDSIPTMSADTRGMARAGAGLQVDSGGLLNVVSGGEAESVNWDNVNNKPATYPVAIATANQLGGVKIGGNLSITEDGVLSGPDAASVESVQTAQNTADNAAAAASAAQMQADTALATAENAQGAAAAAQTTADSKITQTQADSRIKTKVNAMFSLSGTTLNITSIA